MFNWLKNLFKEKPKSKTKRTVSFIVYKKTKFKVGKSLLRIDLEDGTILHKEIIGTVEQSINQDYRYPYVSEPFVTDSVQACNFYRGYEIKEVPLYDREDKTKGYYSKPSTSEIISTDPDFEIEFELASIEYKEIES